MNRGFVLGASILLAASGCAQSYDDQADRLFRFSRSHPIGSSADFYLVKNGLAGKDRVALIFGMGDDAYFCRELAELYMQKYPHDTYWCEAANAASR